MSRVWVVWPVLVAGLLLAFTGLGLAAACWAWWVGQSRRAEDEQLRLDLGSPWHAWTSDVMPDRGGGSDV